MYKSVLPALDLDVIVTKHKVKLRMNKMDIFLRQGVAAMCYLVVALQ